MNDDDLCGPIGPVPQYFETAGRRCWGTQEGGPRILVANILLALYGEHSGLYSSLTVEEESDSPGAVSYDGVTCWTVKVIDAKFSESAEE